MISCLRLSYMKHILQRLTNTRSTTLILTIQALVIGGMQFLIVLNMGWCNIYQVFDSVVNDLDKEHLLKEIKQSGVITEDQIQTLKKRSNDLRRNVISYNWIEHAGNGYGIPLTKELYWIRSFVEKNIYRAKDIEVIQTPLYLILFLKASIITV